MDFAQTEDLAARRLYDVVAEALRLTTVPELLEAVRAAVEPTITDPAQKIALVAAMRDLARTCDNSTSGIERLLNSPLTLKWQDMGLDGDDAPALDDAGRLGLLAAIGGAARGIVLAHASSMVAAYTDQIGVSPEWVGETTPEEGEPNGTNP